MKTVRGVVAVAAIGWCVFFGRSVLASGEMEDGVAPYGSEATAIASHVEPNRPLPKHFAVASDAIGGVPELRAAYGRALRTLPADVVRDNRFLRVDLASSPASLTLATRLASFRVRGRELYYGAFHERGRPEHFAGYAYSPQTKRLVIVACLAPRVGGIAGSWYAGGVVLEDDLDFVILRLHDGRLSEILSDSRCWHRPAVG